MRQTLYKYVSNTHLACMFESFFFFFIKSNLQNMHNFSIDRWLEVWISNTKLNCSVRLKGNYLNYVLKI